MTAGKPTPDKSVKAGANIPAESVKAREWWICQIPGYDGDAYDTDPITWDVPRKVNPPRQKFHVIEFSRVEELERENAELKEKLNDTIRCPICAEAYNFNEGLIRYNKGFETENAELKIANETLNATINMLNKKLADSVAECAELKHMYQVVVNGQCDTNQQRLKVIAELAALEQENAALKKWNDNCGGIIAENARLKEEIEDLTFAQLEPASEIGKLKRELVTAKAEIERLKGRYGQD